MVTHILWGAIRTQPQGCSIVSWLLLSSLPILSLSWLTNIGLSLLELREGHGGWMKPIFYKQETGDMDTLLCPGAPQCPAQFHSLFSRFSWLVPLVCTPLHVCARAHTHMHTHRTALLFSLTAIPKPVLKVFISLFYTSCPSVSLMPPVCFNRFLVVHIVSCCASSPNRFFLEARAATYPYL